tara:strand:+ start:375 stop:599 length:225 start_codon:yes stop_codon:yes gene_type:complete
MSDKKKIEILREYFDLKKNVKINKKDKIGSVIEMDSLNTLKFITFIDEFGKKNAIKNIKKYKNFGNLLNSIKDL